MTACSYQIYLRQDLLLDVELPGAVELGRQRISSEPMLNPARDDHGGAWRINFEKQEERGVPREFLRVVPLAEGRAEIVNTSKKLPLTVAIGEPLAPLDRRQVTLPWICNCGAYAIRIALPDTSLRSLAQPTLAPGHRMHNSVLPQKFSDGLPNLSVKPLVSWFQTVTNLLHSAATSDAFFREAAQAIVELIGLDCGRVLLRAENDWQTAARVTHDQVALGGRTWEPSQRILSRLLANKRTYWEPVPQEEATHGSLADVQAVVAAPILSPEGEVIGALYADRLAGPAQRTQGISELEAMLVETLAGGVAAGLARIEQQRAAIAAQVRFEQFFTPELSRHLAAQPDLLDGRDSEVTLLFCDVRGFSRISERLSPAATFEWIGTVMTALSECVTAHQGVLVDYIGDELLAMWGAPDHQPDHALRACRAALQMVETIHTLSPQWHDRLGEPFGVGIGLNSGQAHVGNTGSRQKFKYGPLGSNVNMASRVQGATKHLRCPLLITETTRKLIGDALPTRRVCRARVVNIQEPVDLYELSTRDDEACQALRMRFEEALAEFEKGQFRESAKHLGRLLSDYPDDGPSLVLLSRAVNAMVAHESDASPVWQLPGK